MASRITNLLSIALVAVAAAGCGASAPARFYTLGSTATADGMPAARYAVLVGPVSVPASVDRPEFVVQVAPNRVEIDEFNRWAAPLNDSVARAVAGDLSVLLGTKDVAVAPLANFNPAYRVTINVQRFESIPGEKVVFLVVVTSPGSDELQLSALYDGVTVDEARAAVAWPLAVAAQVEALAPPAPHELEALRALHARTREAHRRPVHLPA